MLERLPNYDNWKTEPDEADDLDDYDEWLDEVDRRDSMTTATPICCAAPSGIEPCAASTSGGCGGGG